jgi:UDP-N-acetylglucosamine diphosphorylase / glucose-1-phosphate thymidylyltransferase / UDP-N-acetylgalactosamine diphosphorylase / glucosamine-1-phosphate N-acetyltransferase / galactosamine-1-phosphate N-acetyltransferase
MGVARIVFEDGGGRLGPLIDLRVACEVRSGAMLGWQRLGAEALFVPAAREPMVRLRTGLRVNALPKGSRFLLLNGRLLETPRDARRLAVGEALVDAVDGSVLAACLDEGSAAGVIAGRWPDALRRASLDAAPVMRRPWDVLANEALERRLAADADELARRWRKAGELAKPSQVAALRNEKGRSWTARWSGKRTRPIAFEGEAVLVHASARVDAFAVLDSTHGPVVVDRDAHVGSHAVLQGPVYVGPGTIVAPGALLKARTVLGPRCRAAGEIGATIFHGESNKAHDGHLGDAIVGRWVNLGAGTVNSNLLNTYGEVSMRVEPDAPIERTGRQFMGCIVGDHVKTAIGTRIMTGTTLGTGGMIACSAPPPTSTPRFSWLTDDGAKVHRLDRFLATAEVVMKRRGETLQPAERAEIEALHAKAAGGAA